MNTSKDPKKYPNVLIKYIMVQNLFGYSCTMGEKIKENLFMVFLIDSLKTIISQSDFIFFSTIMENLFHFSKNFFTQHQILFDILELFLCLLFKITVIALFILSNIYKNILKNSLGKSRNFTLCIVIGNAYYNMIYLPREAFTFFFNVG